MSAIESFVFTKKRFVKGFTILQAIATKGSHDNYPYNYILEIHCSKFSGRYKNSTVKLKKTHLEKVNKLTLSYLIIKDILIN